MDRRRSRFRKVYGLRLSTYKMAESLNKRVHSLSFMAKDDAVEKIIRLVVLLVMIYLLLKLFRVPFP